MKPLKIVFVGDELDQSKTKMIKMLIQDSNTSAPPEPTTNYYQHNIRIGKQDFKLALFDTTGEEEYHNLRHLSYWHVNLFIIVFDKANPLSFQNITSKWHPELKFFSPETPIILVGLKNAALNQTIATEDIDKLANQIEATAYYDFDLNASNNDKILEKSMRFFPNNKPLPSFFTNFKRHEILPHVNRVVEIGKGSRQENNLFFRVPVDISTQICDYVGNHISKDKTSVNYLNRLLLLNVKNSEPKKLQWNRSLNFKNQTIQIYPDATPKSFAETVNEGIEELVTKFKRLF